MCAGTLALAVFGLFVLVCTVLFRIHWIVIRHHHHISCRLIVDHFIQIVIVGWREVGALLRVLGALLKGRLQGLL